MAKVTEVTLSTASRVKIDGQEREVGLVLTYRLEPEEVDVTRLVREKAEQVERMHRVAWKSIRDEAVAHAGTRGGLRAPPEADGVASDLTGTTIQRDESEKHDPVLLTQIKALDALRRISGMGEDEFVALLTERFECRETNQLSRQQAGSLLVEMQQCQRDHMAICRNRRELNATAHRT